MVPLCATISDERASAPVKADLKGWLSGWPLVILLALADSLWTGIRSGDWVPLVMVLSLMFGYPLLLALGAAGDRHMSADQEHRARAWRAGALVVFASLAIFSARFLGGVDVFSPTDKTWLSGAVVVAALVSLESIRRAAASGSAAIAAFVGGITMTVVIAAGVFIWAYGIRGIPVELAPAEISTEQLLLAAAVTLVMVSAGGAILAAAVAPAGAKLNLWRCGLGFGIAFFVAMASSGVANQAIDDGEDQLFAAYTFSAIVWTLGMAAAHTADEKAGL